MKLGSVRILIFILIISYNHLLSQPTNLGYPLVTNYTKKAIKSGTQTWDIISDDKGYTYFANNTGLLVFDGYSWEIHPIPNNTILRSVGIGPDGLIYVGGQGEFGYFSPNEIGKLEYTSLSKTLDKKIAFDDVWDIVINKSGVFFRTDLYVFKSDFKGKTEAIFYSENSLLYIGQWRDKLVIQDGKNVLYEYHQNKFEQWDINNKFDKGRISSVINYANDTLLVTTIDNGIFYEVNHNFYPWKTEDDNFLRKNIIYAATYLPPGEIVLGTSLNGVVILDKNRKITQHLNKNHGLQNNTVLSTMVTKDGNIWLGLDNGIDMVDLRAPFRHFYPDKLLEGTGYAAMVFDGMLYFGTNTGLYAMPWKKHYNPTEKEKAQLVQGTKGQVWSLNVIDGQLLVGHHQGAFLIQKYESKKITDLLGIWKFISISDKLTLAGHYKGLVLFGHNGNNWQLKNHIKGFNESSRIITKDNNSNIWVSHPYRGVFQIDKNELLSGNVSPVNYSTHNASGISLRNVFYKIGQDIIFDDGKSLYKYQSETNAPVPYNALSAYLPTDSPLNFLIANDENNIWLGTSKNTTYLAKDNASNTTFKKYDINETTGLLPGGFETLYAIDSHNVIFPSEKGFLFLNPSQLVSDSMGIDVMLSKVQLHIPEDSILYMRHKKMEALPSICLPHYANNISFYLMVNTSGSKDFIQFSYKLGMGDNNWSAWSNDAKISFSSLPSGNYSLWVKAKNHAGKESQLLEIPFSISYPWYRTWWAYILYIVGFGFIAYQVYKKQNARHEIEKSTILEKNKLNEEAHIIKAEASKAEITRLQNEKLLAELNYKNQELTSFTYHLVNKNELITEITDVVNKIDHKLSDKPEIRKELKQIIKLTEKNIDVDGDWQNFIKSFDEVHTNFYKRLHETFKDLSPNDYKMCTYLRMNLTTKEIATLMNISIRSVETNRYRLRKKLGLDSETNLTQFLMTF